MSHGSQRSAECFSFQGIAVRLSDSLRVPPAHMTMTYGPLAVVVLYERRGPDSESAVIWAREALQFYLDFAGRPPPQQVPGGALVYWLRVTPSGLSSRLLLALVDPS
jgi:hypothetical protein